MGETFWISEILSFEKIYVGGGITILPQTLCITRGEGVRVTIFHGKNVVSQYRKTSLGNPIVFQKVSGLEKDMNKRGLSRCSLQVFQSHIAEGHRGEPFCISEILSI